MDDLLGHLRDHTEMAEQANTTIVELRAALKEGWRLLASSQAETAEMRTRLTAAEAEVSKLKAAAEKAKAKAKATAAE